MKIFLLLAGVFLVVPFEATEVPERTKETTTSPKHFPEQCREGYWGTYCDSPCNCGPHARECDRHEGCLCQENWEGRHCEVRTSICGKYNPCVRPHERCVDTPDGPHDYECVCPEGFVRSKTGFCVCDEEHYGVNCERICSCGPHSERCDPEEGCRCRAGWQGDHCRDDVDECRTQELCRGEHQTCQNTPGSYRCLCAEGFRWNDHHQCVTIEKPTTRRPTTTKQPKECREGYWGPECEEPCNCGPHGRECGRHEGCICEEGWRGRHCEERKEQPGACQRYQPCRWPHERCVNTPSGSYECACVDGYRRSEIGTCVREGTTVRKEKTHPTTLTTDHREIVTKRTTPTTVCNYLKYMICERYRPPCGPYRVCVNDQRSKLGYRCVPFREGTTVTKEKTHLTTVTTDHRESTDKPCPPYYWGQECERLCTCSEQAVRCDRIKGCVCRPGWKGYHCTEDINECDHNPCRYPTTRCVNTAGSYLCQWEITTERTTHTSPPYYCERYRPPCGPHRVCVNDQRSKFGYRCVPSTTQGKTTTDSALRPAESVIGGIRLQKSVFYIMMAGAGVGVISTLVLIFYLMCGSGRQQSTKGGRNKEKALVAYSQLQEEPVFTVSQKKA